MNARSKPRAAKVPEQLTPDIASERARHLTLARTQIVTETGRVNVVVDAGESPLVWLSRRQGRDGRALIEQHQLQAGERLRREFTVAHLMPRTTSDWDSPLGAPGFNPDACSAEEMIAARQRVRRTLDAVGPEFAGLLIDVCCFLKRLEDVERERQWPARSAKVVLQFALTRLARYYGYGANAKGSARAAVRTWLADDAEFNSGGG